MQSLSGVFLPIPLDGDANAGVKGSLLETLRWPAEVLLLPNETQEMRVLRLAVMPPEEFSAWSVGALAAGAPLAVSRAFRTEVHKPDAEVLDVSSYQVFVLDLLCDPLKFSSHSVGA